MTTLGYAGLPAISQEFLDRLDAAFIQPAIHPGYNQEQAMFDAGCRHVVEWIKSNVPKRTVQGDVVAEQRARVRTGS